LFRDIERLNKQNYKLKENVIVFVEKIELFIAKNIEMKQKKRHQNSIANSPKNDIF
jgi:hypothetical protein